LWLQLGESVFFLVAAVVVYRLLTKDLPPLAVPRIAAYYACVLVGLGILLHFVPGKNVSPAMNVFQAPLLFGNGRNTL
jgi:hypothetical protein